jgi:hypothetical protein
MYPVYRIRPYQYKTGLGSQRIGWRVEVKRSRFGRWWEIEENVSASHKAAAALLETVSKGVC